MLAVEIDIVAAAAIWLRLRPLSSMISPQSAACTSANNSAGRNLVVKETW